MAISLQQIIDSSVGLSFASALGRGLPLRLGYSLADFVAARIIAQGNSKLVRAVRANQWVIRGEMLEKAALDQAVRETFQQSARSIYDLYHYIHNLEKAARLIVLDETARKLLQRPEFGERGLMIVGLHISNFDLVLQSLCQQGLRMMVLTLPNPQGGRLRSTPIDAAALSTCVSIFSPPPHQSLIRWGDTAILPVAGRGSGADAGGDDAAQFISKSVSSHPLDCPSRTG